MRNANTTFVNLRAALDDVDPLVDRLEAGRRELRPFLAELRAAAADAVPTVRDLDAIVQRPGPDNDLVELTRLQPPLADAAIGSGSPDCGRGPETPPTCGAADDDFSQGSFGEAVCSLDNSLRPRLLPRLHARAGRLVRRLRPLRLHRRDRRHRPDRHLVQRLQRLGPSGAAEPARPARPRPSSRRRSTPATPAAARAATSAR